MSFCESNRYKWDYVAEIFVDLQDLHSNDEIPGIINDINRYLKFPENSSENSRVRKFPQIFDFLVESIRPPNLGKWP